MQQSPIQLPLGLQRKDEATFDNFFIGKNQEVVTQLAQTASGFGERFIYIYSAKGAGVSHLLQAACHRAHFHQITSVYLPCEEILKLPQAVLNGLETLDLICIDNLEKIAGIYEWEEAFFHLYNRVYDNHGRIIMGARDLPKAIPFKLPDLLSRLAWGMMYPLYPLSDQEKLLAIKMRCARRGISLSEEVGNYLITHVPRHLGNLFAILDQLDQAQLIRQRKLTIPFVKEVLNC